VGEGSSRSAKLRSAAAEVDLTRTRRGPDPPTAILAMSDILAIGALEAAVELQVSLPAELSIVGFDDGPAALHTSPPLTTVAQPHEEKGRLAAQWLLEEVDGGEARSGPPRRAILPTQLIVRESTGPRGR